MKTKNKIKLAAAVGFLGYSLYRHFRYKPQRAYPVQPFDIFRFLGDWYQVACTTGTIDSGMIGSMVVFSMCKDGSVLQTTIGVDRQTGMLRKHEGRMVFRGRSDAGAFKISYRAPIYRGYNVVTIDPHYRYALVIGHTAEEAWILSRDPEIPSSDMDRLRGIAYYIGVSPESLQNIPQED